MVFNFYHRLSPSRQRTYDRSDAIETIALANALALQPLVHQLKTALEKEDRPAAQTLSQQLADAMTAALRVPKLRVQILAVRPSNSDGELHGMYLPEDGGKPTTIQVWMRTAKHKRVVAFRSFLRTLLHELCHHFDYELFHLPDTFHTEGFYKRESSLFRQLMSTPEATNATPK